MEAPVDDEPIDPEEETGTQESWQEYLNGEARPWDEVEENLPLS